MLVVAPPVLSPSHCGPPLPQVTPDRRGQRYGFSLGGGRYQPAEQYGSSAHSRTAASAAPRTAAPSTSTREDGMPCAGHTQTKASGPGGAGAGPGSPCPSPGDPTMSRCPPGRSPARCSAGEPEPGRIGPDPGHRHRRHPRHHIVAGPVQVAGPPHDRASGKNGTAAAASSTSPASISTRVSPPACQPATQPPRTFAADR